MHIFGGSKPTGTPAQASTGALPYIGEREFEQEVLLSELPVLVQFTSERSPAHKQVAPDVESFAQEMQGKLKVVLVDVEKAPNLVRQVRIQQVPTFMLFVDQRLGDMQAGALSKKALRAMVEPFLPRQQGALKPKELAELIKQGVAVPVDTRDAAAFNRAHLPGAKNIPLEELAGRLAELYMLPGQPVLYDRSGDKVKELVDSLGDADAQLAFLEGGLIAWETEALPIERP